MRAGHKAPEAKPYPQAPRSAEPSCFARGFRDLRRARAPATRRASIVSSSIHLLLTGAGTTSPPPGGNVAIVSAMPPVPLAFGQAAPREEPHIQAYSAKPSGIGSLITALVAVAVQALPTGTA